MRLLEFLDEGVQIPHEPGGPGVPPGLRREEPRAYERWMAHVCSGDPRLAPWLDRLASGSAVVVLAGQQPALLGGPLYTLYKVLTALVAARRMRSAGLPALAAFWCVGDDTDHDEVGFASWPRGLLPPARVRDETPHLGERIGGLPLSRMEEAFAQLRGDWPAATEVLGRIESARAAAAGWSGFLAATLRAILPEPILFVDGNDPATIDASRAWLSRAAPRRAELRDALRAHIASELPRSTVPALAGEEAGRCLFVVEGPGRRLLPEDELPSPDQRLIPNVVLRPLLQEYLLPVAQVICGDAEIAYRRLLSPIYARLGGKPAPVARRFGATLFPRAWASDPEAPTPSRTLSAPDQALEDWARAGLDPALGDQLSRTRREVVGALEDLLPHLAEVDRSLPQLLESARGKIDFQLRRIEEAVVGKVRQQLQRKGPEIAHLREFLLPRGARQERSFTLWTPALYEGLPAYGDLERIVETWFDRGGKGHALIAIEGGGA